MTMRAQQHAGSGPFMTAKQVVHTTNIDTPTAEPGCVPQITTDPETISVKMWLADSLPAKSCCTHVHPCPSGTVSRGNSSHC